MAFTATIRKKTVWGDQRVIQYLMTADAASGSVNTGMKYIDSFSWGPQSMTSANTIIIRANALGGATAAVGYVGFDGMTSGDAFFLNVIGH